MSSSIEEIQPLTPACGWGGALKTPDEGAAEEDPIQYENKYNTKYSKEVVKMLVEEPKIN
jgi:hypothetical protein